jgi:multimeric flavodoxin WrbA
MMSVLMSLPSQAFWDTTSPQWASGAFAGKYAGAFVSTAGPGGGQEVTIQNSISTLTHHGIVFVPLGYSHAFGQITGLTEVHGGACSFPSEVSVPYSPLTLRFLLLTLQSLLSFPPRLLSFHLHFCGFSFIIEYSISFHSFLNIDDTDHFSLLHRTGSPWGAGTFAAPDGSRQPTALELELAEIQGKAFYGVVSKVAF